MRDSLERPALRHGVVDTLPKRQPDGEPGQPREALSEQRNRPAVFAQTEGLQQRADAIEQHGGGVLLESEVLNTGQEQRWKRRFRRFRLSV